MSTNQAESPAPHEAPRESQTTPDTEIAAAAQHGTGPDQKPFSERMRKIGMKMFGPADSGPYGPPTEPPAPRPRDRWGHPLKEPKAKN
jgi:hypothetical protein